MENQSSEVQVYGVYEWQGLSVKWLKYEEEITLRFPLIDSDMRMNDWVDDTENGLWHCQTDNGITYMHSGEKSMILQESHGMK